MPATYERLDKTGLQYLLGKLKTQIENSMPSTFTGADGSNAGTAGVVPAPAAADNTKFLKGDGTWATISMPSVFTGADGTNAGSVGTVPAPAATDNIKFLKGDGTWAAIPSAPIQGIQKNGTDLTPDANGKVNVTVPTAVSDLTNDSGFQDAQDVADAIAIAVAAAYKAAGTKTFAEISGLNVAANQGKVYDISDAFTTTADFVEGAGQTYPAGTNIAVINTGTDQSPVWKFDVMAGFIDTSAFVTHTESAAITNAEIDTIWTAVFNPSSGS